MNRRSKKFPSPRKTFLSCIWQPLPLVSIYDTDKRCWSELDKVMKVLPVFFALIPLAAVVTACVQTL